MQIKPKAAPVQPLASPVSLARVSLAHGLGWLPGGVLLALAVSLPLPAPAFVALMAGQQARPLNGTFNTVPVLHSNQPEEVEGPGILINTAPGVSYAAENGMALNNAEYTFNGEFGLHIHHKYIPPAQERWSGSRRSELTLALILINPGYRPVHLRFSSGSVRNSFQAPYLANNLMGVKPLGIRPWNTGPGDATATQMLRGKLDSNLADEITIPERSRVVLFRTELPALGIANALLKGRSDGPFQMAVVAAREPNSDYDVVAVLDQGRLAPGRVYLNRITDINNRQVFSRVGGIAAGDTYQANLDYDLDQQGPLHVPFTSTHRNEFGTREVQVNPLLSRMLDSSLDNVGTYGVRYEVTLNLKGSGPYELVMSHPVAYGRRQPFTAFRGSMQVQTESGVEDLHIGLRSGESLALTTLNLKPGVANQVKVTMVYPADATPGHLLSVVPSVQLASLKERQRQQELAQAMAKTMTKSRKATVVAPPDLAEPANDGLGALFLQPMGLTSLPPLPPPALGTGSITQSLVERYQQAVEPQQQSMQRQVNP
jgi:hypothetical protein